MQKQKSRSQKEPEQSAVPAKTASTEALKTDLDDILDEIDGVLEKNAQEFVDSYIQKGGE